MTHASARPQQPGLTATSCGPVPGGAADVQSAARSSVRARRTRRAVPLVALLGLAALIACGAQGGAAPGEEVTPSPDAAAVTAAVRPTGGAAYGFVADPSGARTRLVTQRLTADVSAGHLLVDPIGAAWHLDLQWIGLGRGGEIAAVPVPAREANLSGQRATYVRGNGSEEWYTSAPRGLEQGFVLPLRPAGGNDSLTLDLAVQGLDPELSADGARVRLNDAQGRSVASYGELAVFDATGAPMRAWLEVDGSHIRVRVDDAEARYPLTIDPIVWSATPQEFDGAAAGDWFGYSVAVSGSIAVVGAPNHAGGGTAYVYTQGGTGTWTLTTNVTATGEAAGDLFGSSVAVSGSYIIVGAPSHAAGKGAAYIFSGASGTWTQSAELDGTTANGAFGTSVGISALGTAAVAIVGAPNPASQAGAAYAYTLSSAGMWAPAPALAGGGAAGDAFGTSVSVSLTTVGTTAVVGAPYHTPSGGGAGAGAAYVFSETGTSWTAGPVLTASDGAENDGFGTSVSASGPTILRWRALPRRERPQPGGRGLPVQPGHDVDAGHGDHRDRRQAGGPLRVLGLRERNKRYRRRLPA